MEGLITDILDPNYYTCPPITFMHKLSHVLYCLNYRYYFHVDKEVRYPKKFNPTIGVGVRDPNRYSNTDTGHEPFSLRESKKEYLDKFIKLYLLERNIPKEFMDNVVMTKEDLGKSQIISLFLNHNKTYKRILIKDKNKFFKLLRFDPNKIESMPYVDPHKIEKLYSSLEDASHIPIQDKDIEYIVNESGYVLEPLERDSNNEIVFY